jgi:mannosyltransferase
MLTLKWMMKERRSLFLLAAVTVAALLLRLAFLGAKSFDLDEAVSVMYARLDWVPFRHVARSDVNMSLYYCLLHVWRYLGESEAAVRFLSVIPAVATVPAVYALGTRLFSSTVGLIAALLLCVSAFHIRYAQEARGYSLVVLLVVLSGLFFVRTLERSSRRDFARYLTASALAFYSHFFAALVLVAQGASLVIPRPRRMPVGALLTGVAAIGGLTIPLAVFAARRDAGQLTWIPRPTSPDVVEFFRVLTGGGTPPELLLGVYLAALLAGVAGAGGAWRRWKTSWQAWRCGLLVLWFGVPILLALLISTIKPVFIPYYLIVCLPPLTLLAAAGLSRINHPRVLAGALAVFVVLALRGDYEYYTDSSLKDDFRGATHYVLRHAQRGDAILFLAGYSQVPFDYYRSRLPRTAGGEGIAILPRDVSNGWMSPPPQYERMWLFLSHDEYVPATIERSIEALLGARYPVMVEQIFQGIRVRLYSRHAAIPSAGRAETAPAVIAP